MRRFGWLRWVGTVYGPDGIARCGVLAREGAGSLGLAVATVLIGLAAAGPPAMAESLKSAMASAYRNYPELDAERARLRATDEGVQRARSGWAPSINSEVTLGVSRTRTRPPSGNSDIREGLIGLDITQPLFTGFRTHHAVNEAEAEVRAQRAQLEAVEARLLLDVARAYLDVVRDREIVRLSDGIVGVLTRELSNARSRLRVGEVTRTDVSQAQSRRAESLLDLEQARGNLARSVAVYRRLVGRRPVGLARKNLRLGKLPRTLKAAIAAARQRNPLVIRALYREQSARSAVSKERSELLPRLDLEAGFSRRFERGGEQDRTDSAALIGRLQIPIYQGGAVRARVREVKHIHVGRLQEVEQARRFATNDVRTGFANLKAAARKIRADKARIRYQQAALAGVREEERVGQRTLLDVLNAEQEVFNARVSLARSVRDRSLGHYEVLRGVGDLNARFLSLAAVQYDPEEHYFDARKKWLTTAITRQPPTEWSTTTIAPAGRDMPSAGVDRASGR